MEQEVELGRTMAVEKEDEGWTGVGVMVETGYAEEAELETGYSEEAEKATELLDGTVSEFAGVEAGYSEAGTTELVG